MKETQGALGMLLRRYRLILGKCRLRNALAGLLLGAVLLAPAVSPADSGGKEGRPGHPESSHYTGTTDGASGPYTADGGHVIISNRAGDLDASSFYGGHADGKGTVPWAWPWPGANHCSARATASPCWPTNTA